MMEEGARPSTPQLIAPSLLSTNGGARMHSKEEWDALRHIIERLYSHEDKPLKQVMAILCVEHGFVATLVLLCFIV
jgi:hypothetical protein